MYLGENAYINKWSRSSSVDGTSCEKTVYQVENGFILYIEEREIPKEGSEVKYKEPKISVYISKENPFEMKDKKEESTKDLMSMFKDVY